MKKSLLMILGAALLMVGCTKELETAVNNIQTKLETLESKVAANEAAIKTLKAAQFIQNVEQTSDGWNITVTGPNGDKVLHVYNGQDGANGKDGTNGKDGAPGKDGADGDAFFQSVEIVGEEVVFTLTDGTVITVPYAKAFRLVIEPNAEAIPGSTTKIPYSIENGTETTTVDAFASGLLFAEVNAEASTIDVTVPDPFEKGFVLAWADNGKGATSIKKLTITEKAYAEVTDVEPVDVAGGNIEVPVVSNVEIEILDETEDWLSYKETKSTKYTVVLVAEANNGEARTSEVKVVRKSDKFVLQTITIAQKACPKVTLGENTYETIQAALTAAEALTEGTALIKLGGYEFAEAVKIDGDKIAVPVVIDGQNVATLTGGIETSKNATTVKDMTIVVAEGNKSTLGGDYSNSNYDSGIHICVSGYGIVIDNVTFDNKVVNATSVYVAAPAESPVKDVVKNCKFGGEGQRAMQVYGGPIEILDNEFTAAYGSYVMRVGYKTPSVVIAGNKFNCTSTTAVNIHSSLVAGGTITFGDGEVDNNEYATTVANIANGGTANAVTILPAAYATLPVANSAVKLNGIPAASIQAALTSAEALSTGTALITVAEGTTLTEEVKIDGSKIKVPVVIDGKAQSTTLVGSFEIKGIQATIRNFTINPTETSTTTLGEEGWYTNSFTTGVEIDGSGFGAVVENVTINTTLENSTGIWIGHHKGEIHDVIRNVTINGAGSAGRKIQAYGAYVDIINSTFNGSYSYAVRIGDTNGSDVVLKGNRFNSGRDENAVAVQFNSFGNGKVVLGDGLKNDNTQDGSFRSLFGAGNEWLFHNNNFFYPDVEYAAANNDLNVIDKLGRVWAKWHAVDNTWDDAICDPAANNWDRHAAALGRYFYVPSAHRVDTKIAVFDVLTGEHVYTITEGFDASLGLFKLCSIAKLGDAVYASSMSNSGKLAIYKLTDEAGGYYTKAKLAQAIDVPTGERFGDDMTAFGDDNEGALIFVSYSTAGATDASTRTIWEIPVINGEVGATPLVPIRGVTAAGNYIGGLYIYEYTGSALGKCHAGYDGVGGERHGLYYSNVGNTGYVAWTWGLDPYGDGIPALEQNVQAPKFLTVDGQKYFMYVSAPSKKGYLRLIPITGDNYKAGFKALIDVENLNTVSTVYPLVVQGRADAEGPTGTNGTGFCDWTVIDGETYVIAGATENGWSCFKFNK